MRSRRAFVSSLAVVLAALPLGLVISGPGWTHCDTVGGPVIADARIALERSDVTPVLKWVNPENESTSSRAAWSFVGGSRREATMERSRLTILRIKILHSIIFWGLSACVVCALIAWRLLAR